MEHHPIVQCAVNDSISVNLWQPETPIDISRLRAIGDPRNREIQKKAPKEFKDYVEKNHAICGFTSESKI